MELQNYYRLLNIETSADTDTLKKAFRTEIALYHPDNNKSEGAKVRFELLVEAFDILSHPKKREAYDKLLQSSETNIPVIIEPKAEEQYKEWKKESKKKSESYWSTSLAELLVLDIFIDAGLNGLFSGDLLDGIGDSLGDIGDLFDIF
jgi:DnaJ-class molecular chaperone